MASLADIVTRTQAGPGSLSPVQLAADSPTAADWLAAWGQVGGAVATFLAVLVAVWLGWRDRRWRRKDQADRDAAQGRLISVEIEFADFEVREDGTPDARVFVVVTNGSLESILQLTLRNTPENLNAERRWADVSSGEVGHRPWMPVLPPGETWKAEIMFVHSVDGQLQRLPAPFPIGEGVANIAFTDARGLRWTRRGMNAPIREITSERKQERDD